jgi:hypothetical protein
MLPEIRWRKTQVKRKFKDFLFTGDPLAGDTGKRKSFESFFSTGVSPGGEYKFVGIAEGR